jgi:hypothetical protein
MKIERDDKENVITKEKYVGLTTEQLTDKTKL